MILAKIPKKRAPKAASEAAPKKLELRVDYPMEGDRIRPGHYAIRLSADGATQAQVAVDGQDWQDCRGAVGYFWFDWSPEALGEHKIEARARVGKGRWAKAAARACDVIEP